MAPSGGGGLVSHRGPEPELSCGCLPPPPPHPPTLAVHCGPCCQAPSRDAACGALIGGAGHASCVVARSLLSLQQRLCNKLKSIFLKGVSAVCFQPQPQLVQVPDWDLTGILLGSYWEGCVLPCFCHHFFLLHSIQQQNNLFIAKKKAQYM